MSKTRRKKIQLSGFVSTTHTHEKKSLSDSWPKSHGIINLIASWYHDQKSLYYDLNDGYHDNCFSLSGIMIARSVMRSYSRIQKKNHDAQSSYHDAKWWSHSPESWNHSGNGSICSKCVLNIEVDHLLQSCNIVIALIFKPLWFPVVEMKVPCRVIAIFKTLLTIRRISFRPEALPSFRSTLASFKFMCFMFYAIQAPISR